MNASAPPASDRRPNVLFVITHDLSPRFGCYGDPYAVTPHLDALAQQATRFDRHYCQWPLCGPSRASLFSGLRPQHTRRHDNRPFWSTLRQRQPAGYATMGEAFKNAGYRSECVWHALHAYETDPPSWSGPAWFPPNPPAPPSLEVIGAEELRYWQSPASFELIRERLARLRERGVPESQYARRARGPAVESADVDDAAYTDGRATNHAVKLLTELRDDARPFFLAVGYEAGHLPWTAPKRDFDLYDRDAFAVPQPTRPPLGSPEFALNDNEPAQYYTQHDYDQPWTADPAQAREMLHGHYASISFLDRQIGRLLQGLRDAGVDQQTMVVVTSDHGFHMGEHNYWGKHSAWDASMHCPLILRRPGQQNPAVVEQCTEHVDLHPTLCDAAGIARPAGLDGRSLLDPQTQPDPCDDSAAVSYRRRLPGDGSCRYFDLLSIRTPRHRLTLYRDEAGREIGVELFDYLQDPQETRNHAGQPGYDQVEATLRQRLAPHLAAFPGEG